MVAQSARIRVRSTAPIHPIHFTSGKAVDAVGDFNIATQIEAARSYVRLRRRYRGYFLGMPALLFAFVTLIALFGRGWNSYMGGILIALLVVGWCAYCVGSTATWFALVGFRCPRCGKRFIMSWWNTWPSNHCKHCDLDLGPAVLATAKPLAETHQSE
jgi:hypothetical protein